MQLVPKAIQGGSSPWKPRGGIQLSTSGLAAGDINHRAIQQFTIILGLGGWEGPLRDPGVPSLSKRPSGDLNSQPQVPQSEASATELSSRLCVYVNLCLIVSFHMAEEADCNP